MKTTLLLAAFTGLVMAACGDDEEAPGATSAGTSGSGAAGSSGRGGSSGSGGSGATAATGGTGGSVPDAGTDITISGIARDWAKADPFATPPLAEVKVCLRDHPEVACATTAQDGAWELRGAPRNAEVMVTLEKSGRFSFLRAIKTADSDIAMPAFENTLNAGVGRFEPIAQRHDRPDQGRHRFFHHDARHAFSGLLRLDARIYRTWDPAATASAAGSDSGPG